MFKKLFSEISKAVVGQEQLLDMLLTALLSPGHAIIIGVPGLAKTLLVKTLARVFNIDFTRIQFTPDLMPSDLIGYEILEETSGKKRMKFIKGPVFTNLLLADEINRTPPKTQSALLQAMQEKEVSVSGETMQLDEPFFVLATQNPLEFEGTYPLPEAQLDRFMFMLPVNYPARSEEVAIALKDAEAGLEHVNKIFSKKDLIDFQKKAADIPIAEKAADWIVQMVQASRPECPNCLESVKKYVRYGAGPRASRFTVRAARAAAFIEGCREVERHHIEKVFPAIMRHRIILNFAGNSENILSDDIIRSLLDIKL
ncbi:MAG: hypothetical protein A2096_10240 [Spirochaetes bacterium GWF1_41_5]|nr:MAG: hypothetical protein A2096_10240 [Spirochaetes bacterium GWF1_41_5]HBE03226.1 AAA family ATPase [Spirochaetia bacterium]